MKTISAESCLKYAEVCQSRAARLMDIKEAMLFEALAAVCRQAAAFNPAQTGLVDEPSTASYTDISGGQP